MGNIPLIVLGAIVLIGGIAYFAYNTAKLNAEERANRIPGPNEIFIPEETEPHLPTKGDFYIRDNKADANPFEMYNVYRIDDVRKNIYGDYWVKYTAPGYTSDYAPSWKELECPLDSFLAGKIRVEKIKK